MERMFIPNKIKSEESSIHKDSNINTKTQKKLFSRDFATPTLADTQNTICININTSSYIQYLKSLGNNFLSKPQISNITDFNINNINFSDDNNKDNEIKKKKEDFELNSNKYLGKKRKILFNSTKKSNESNLFKTYIFDPSKTRLKIFRINKIN